MVLTLKANGVLVGLDKVKYSVICLVNDPEKKVKGVSITILFDKENKKKETRAVNEYSSPVEQSL